MDAGFWSAMHIKRKSSRDLCSIVFTLYYLLCAEQADEKVRKIRSVVTVDHLRISWNKNLTPYLNFVTKLSRPRLMRYQPRAIRIPRPEGSSYSEPIQGWLYFDGPISALKKHRKVILNIPGGGFVAMSPRTHDDSLMAWAGRTGLPVLSLDYRKAPEYPYPYALNECYDVYLTIISSQGRCLGLSGDAAPQVVISGDSAGGNLAASLVLMILQTDDTRWQEEDSLPVPIGLVLIYPCLDMNIGNWMTDEQMSLIRDRSMRSTNKAIIERKDSAYRTLTPSTPHPTDEPPTLSLDNNTTKKSGPGTRLAVPSMISYVSDRMLTPEMMRAMIILYIGPYTRPSFGTDYLLSPVLAPASLLARFPKTYFLTGERDPLVDDTAIMAGRIRSAKKAAFASRAEMNLLPRAVARRGWHAEDDVEVQYVGGASHGFIQLASVYPAAWGYIHRVGTWYEACFASAERREREGLLRRRERRTSWSAGMSSGDDEPLEMGMKGKKQPESPGVEKSPRRPGVHRKRSMVSLGSEDDLLGRRMRGLVGGLTRRRED